MGKIARFVLIALLLMAILVAIWMILAICSSIRRFNVKEMDWDGDGRTTVMEIVEGADVGKRMVEKYGKECIEYFSFKDGLPLKIDCGRQAGEL